jgi:hypothetical protein
MNKIKLRKYCLEKAIERNKGYFDIVNDIKIAAAYEHFLLNSSKKLADLFNELEPN